MNARLDKPLPACEVRLGDLVKVGDDWQRVTFLMHDAARREAVIYTTSEEDAALRVGLLVPVLVSRRWSTRRSPRGVRTRRLAVRS